MTRSPSPRWSRTARRAAALLVALAAPLHAAVPTPILEYRHEQASWTGATGEVLDTSGSGYHGKAAGLAATKPSTASTSPVVSTSPGTCRYAVFNRANKDYLALPSNFPALGANGSFTITAWIRSTDASATGQRVFADNESNNNGYGLSLGDGGAGRLRFFTKGARSSVDLDSAAVVASNVWVHVVASVNFASRTKSLRVYDVAGTLLSSVSATYTESSIGNDSGIASIGGETNASTGQATASYGFAGDIDEVRVYTSVLSAAEIDSVRALRSNCPYAVLVAEYHFEEPNWRGSTGELTDSAGYSGGPFHGIAQGSPLPVASSTAPARSGSTGTCGYATLPGPTGGGGDFGIGSLPVSTLAGAQTSLSFWLYWDGTDLVSAMAWGEYVLGFGAGAVGFHTSNNDLYGASSSGLARGWHHMVAIFTNGSMTSNRLYIDGSLRTLTQIYGSPALANATVGGSLQIGGYAGSTGYRLTGRVDQLRIYNGALSATEVTALYAQTHACTSLHHIEIAHASGTGVTCTPSTLTLKACADAACSTTYSGGVSGTLTASGAGMSVVFPTSAGFSIAAGSTTTTEDIQLTTAGSVLLGASGTAPTPTAAASCTFGSPACTYSAADAGLVFSVPHHAAESAQTVSVSALRKSDSAAACVPAFANASKSVTFTCAYQNPSSGTLPARVGGRALNAGNSAAAACDATGQAVSLAFNASGVASTSVQYADVGQLRLDARYTGSGSDAGLVMSGSSSFVAAPASFAIDSVTAGPIKAGSAFSARVTARNASATATPNFGRESSPQTPVLAYTRAQPTGSGASDGVFSGSPGTFSGGAATATNLVWSEVGRGDLAASLSSYLGSGLAASGSTGSAGAIGRFIPHHFDVVVTPGCTGFTYAGQPFTTRVTARNGLATPTTTVNYDAGPTTSPSFAQAVTLADAPVLGVGGFGSTATLAAAAFRAGVATSAGAAYTYTDKLTAARTVVVRATDADGVSSAGFESLASTPLRSGRLRLSNAFGSEKSALSLAVQAQYWSGNAWVANGADSCTTLPAAAVVRAATLDHRGVASSGWSTSASAIVIGAGNGVLTLSAPLPSVTGSVDLALNLGATATDQSCLANHPASSGAGLPWLRAQQGSCSSAWDRDPAARATFGIHVPETRRTVHVREIY